MLLLLLLPRILRVFLLLMMQALVALPPLKGRARPSGDVSFLRLRVATKQGGPQGASLKHQGEALTAGVCVLQQIPRVRLLSLSLSLSLSLCLSLSVCLSLPLSLSVCLSLSVSLSLLLLSRSRAVP